MTVRPTRQKKPVWRSDESNETFITWGSWSACLFSYSSVQVLVVPNFYLPQNMLNLFANWFIVTWGIGITFLHGYRQLRYVGWR